MQVGAESAGTWFFLEPGLSEALLDIICPAALLQTWVAHRSQAPSGQTHIFLSHSFCSFTEISQDSLVPVPRRILEVAYIV